MVNLKMERSGFTLIGIALILVIIGIMVTIGAGMIGTLTKRAKFTENRETVTEVYNAVVGYAAANKKLPSTLASLGVNTTDAYTKSLQYYTATNITTSDLCTTQGGYLTIDDKGASKTNIAFIVFSESENRCNETGISSPFAIFSSGTTGHCSADAGLGYDDIVMYMDINGLREQICNPFRVVTDSLPIGREEVSYPSTTLQATDGTPSYTWSNTGSLPTGLSLSSGGVISGTPTADGTSNFMVMATDAESRTAIRVMTIVIDTNNPVVSTIFLHSGTISTAYSASLSATGGTGSYTWGIISGSLPDGLSLSGDTISGTPTTAGIYLFTVQSTDSRGRVARRPLKIVVSAAAISCNDDSAYNLVFSDDFDDGDYSGWNIVKFNSNNCNWYLSSNHLYEKSNSCNGFMSHDPASDGIDPNTTNYSITATVWANTGNTYNNDVGFIFGYQNSSNYYKIRWDDYSTSYTSDPDHKDFQLLKVSNGLTTVLDKLEQIDLPDSFSLKVIVSDSDGIRVFVDCNETRYRLNALSEQPALRIFGLSTHDNDGGVYYDDVELRVQSTGGGGSATSCGKVTNGLVAWWKFEDNFNDSSGQGNDGVGYGGVSFAAGKFGKGASFDGGNDYIAIQNMVYSNAGDISTRTVCAWFKTYIGGSSWTSNWAFVDFDRSEYFNFFIYGDTGELGFATRAGSIVDMRAATSANDGLWHFGCAVFNSADVYDKKIYLDGALDAQQDAYSTGTNLGSGTVRYGFIGDGSEATSFNGSRNYLYYQGMIDETCIYNRALSQSEIQTIMGN